VTNPGQCAGDAGSWPEFYGGDIEGTYNGFNAPNCITDGADLGCGELFNNLHGSAVALFEALSLPPAGWLPVSQGAQPTCPGCCYSPSGPFQDAIWDPNAGIGGSFDLWGITWYLDHTFTSPFSYRETINTLKRVGYVEYPQDYVDFLHMGARDLRDQSPLCSAHIAVDYPVTHFFDPEATYTTGTWHIDTFNPWAEPAIPGGTVSQALGHLIADTPPLQLYPSSQVCP
jgi:hypothetical protein